MNSLQTRISRIFEAKFRSKPQKLYISLYNCIKYCITNNDIPQGSTLPSTRVLAEKLGMSRSTVIKAYELLMLEGYVEAKAGSGYQIKYEYPGVQKKAHHAQLPFGYPSMSKTGKSFLKNVMLINSTSDRSIAFRPGLPPLDIFPVNQWKNLSNLYWRHIKASALSYSPSSGIESLKRNIANYLNITRNLKCDYRQVIIVSGSLQSLYLIGNVLVDSGDRVIMENPTFPNVHSIFKSLRARILPVGIDKEGILVSKMEGIEHRKAKLIHATPSNHYPTGVRMSLARRQELLAWAHQNKSLIIENDYEHEVSNWNDPIPSLFSLDTQGRTIYMGTFNRLLHPSIRLGYMVVPFYLLEAVEALQNHSHRFVPPSTQIVMNQFIEKKHLITHVRNVIHAAADRKEVFLKTFTECFNDTISLVQGNSDGLFVLAKIHADLNDKALISHLERHNIIAHAYSKCFITPQKEDGLILGYSSVRKPEIKKKLQQMATLYNEHTQIGL